MSPGAHGKLVIWTVDDGRTGITNQTRGLAEAIGALVPARIDTHIVNKKLFNFGRARKPQSGMEAPWPDICIGCGRASIPYLRAMRHWTDGRTLTVQLQDPRIRPSQFDLVIPPKHDRLEGDNVFPILGAPTRITSKALEQAGATFAKDIEKYPRPRLAIVLGGNSKHHTFTGKACKRLVRSLQGLMDNQVSLLITTSRRTPKNVIKSLRRQFGKKDQVWLWTGASKDGPNPYFAFLQAADAVLVTNDSTNLLTEAASAGKPILLFALEGHDAKFNRLYDSLAGIGLARPFTGSLATWPVEPLDETSRAAKEVMRRLYVRLKENNNV